jgi:hypothetical protein
MVVPFPDHGMRALTAVIDSHRRLQRMTSEDNRRRSRVELPDPRGIIRPRVVASGPRLALRTARVAFGACVLP